MLNRLTSGSTRRPWLVIGVWVALLIAGVLVGQAKLYDVTTNDTAGFLPRSYESARAVQFGQTHFGLVKGATAVTALVQRTDGRPLTARDRARVASLTAGMATWRPDWTGMEPPFGLSDNERGVRAVHPVAGPVAGQGRYQLAALQFKGNATDPTVQKAFKQFRAVTVHAFARDGLRVGFTGGVANQTDFTDATKSTQSLEGVLLFAAIALLSLVFFRGVLSTFVPLLTVVLVAGGANGAVVLAAMAFGYHLDSSTPTLIQTVLVGIGIDYFLFMTFRFREQLRAGDGRRDAAQKAAGKVGPVVASAALAIVAAFATLGLARFGQFHVLGPAVAVAIVVMLLAGVTLVPALLAAQGRLLFWPSRSWRHSHEEGPAARLGLLVSRRPGLVAAVATAALTVLAAFALGGKMNYDLGSTPKDTQAGRVQAAIGRILPKGVTDEQQIYVRSSTPLTTAALEPMRTRLAAVNHVADVSPAQLSADRRAAEIDVALDVDATSGAGMHLAGANGPLRTAAHGAAPAGSTALVGGRASVFADVSRSISDDLRLIFPVAAGLILLILFVMLRSAVAPLYLLLAVGLEFAATFGATVLLFQAGLGKDGVAFTLPLILFLFVVAIGTDYNILMSHRLREERENGASPREATARAVQHAAPAITAAGLALSASFATLMLYSDTGTQQMGFGMAVGILLASFVVSTLLVPAVTTLVGSAAWWPGRLARRPARDRRGQPSDPAVASATTGGMTVAR
ncbi:MAG TPA: MMPL family transporter [Gaiellales bacterium]